MRAPQIPVLWMDPKDMATSTPKAQAIAEQSSGQNSGVEQQDPEEKSGCLVWQEEKNPIPHPIGCSIK